MASKVQINSVIIGSILICSNIASANDAPIGKDKLAVCSGCHGLKGNSSIPFRPNLASQNADYIVSQLKAFKSGSRLNDTMRESFLPTLVTTSLVKTNKAIPTNYLTE